MPCNIGALVLHLLVWYILPAACAREREAVVLEAGMGTTYSTSSSTTTPRWTSTTTSSTQSSTAPSTTSSSTRWWSSTTTSSTQSSTAPPTTSSSTTSTPSFNDVPEHDVFTPLVTECGFGSDRNGDNVTHAVVRACQNALEFFSMPALAQLAPASSKLQVQLGVPPAMDWRGDPDWVVRHEVEKFFP